VASADSAAAWAEVSAAEEQAGAGKIKFGSHPIKIG
jgi:hypothetical protein